MKRILMISLALGVAIMACRKNESAVVPVTIKTPAPHSGGKYTNTTDVFNSQFISVARANSMISSYLYSIGGPMNDTDVRSFSVNADSLRLYLENTDIKKVKLMFAHTEGYILDGNTGVYAGLQSGAITIVIAGYDDMGDYIYNNGKVLEHLAPCPYTCPSGDAESYLLQ